MGFLKLAMYAIYSAFAISHCLNIFYWHFLFPILWAAPREGRGKKRPSHLAIVTDSVGKYSTEHLRRLIEQCYEEGIQNLSISSNDCSELDKLYRTIHYCKSIRKLYRNEEMSGEEREFGLCVYLIDAGYGRSRIEKIAAERKKEYCVQELEAELTSVIPLVDAVVCCRSRLTLTGFLPWHIAYSEIM